MVKKCIVCEEEAKYKIKDTSDYYCEECAKENFADIDLLVKVEEVAKQLKEFLKKKMQHMGKGEEEEKQDKEEILNAQDN
ncbi:MAG: hypothetical protein ABH824_02885 [Nanoarchaeota archaeon]|nr:hypothetical protein [Nanoarchaeota archaeon]MBU1632078.1 hypothetical protein [Nanoarchaeota archaeon]MBU1875712.1 hypothetical protein [Nanoarchaeota archaeon]